MGDALTPKRSDDHGSNHITTTEMARLRSLYDARRSSETCRTYGAGWRSFVDWCASREATSLPATPETVALYFQALSATHSLATVRTYRAAIADAHKSQGHDSPTSHPVVEGVLAGIAREKALTRPRQARGAVADDVSTILEALGDDLVSLRAGAMLTTARSCLARRSELVAMNWGDVDLGGGIAQIFRRKTQEWTPCALTEKAVESLGVWQKACVGKDSVDEPVFRRLVHCGKRGLKAQVDLDGHSYDERSAAGLAAESAERGGECFQGARHDYLHQYRLGARLSAGSVPSIFRNAYIEAGLDPGRITGHSARVGTVEDLTAAGADAVAIAQAGGWTDASMPVRYGKQMAAKRGAVAKLLGV